MSQLYKTLFLYLTILIHLNFVRGFFVISNKHYETISTRTHTIVLHYFLIHCFVSHDSNNLKQHIMKQETTPEKRLKLFRCSGDWDKLLGVIADRVTGLVEVHLERLQVSDAGLTALSNCLNLEILHLVKTPECTNDGLKVVAEHCKLLRKLHIDGWKTNRISDEGLIAVAKNCPNLQELVLIGVNPTRMSLEKLATCCPNLERLALCGSETVGDAEISCIAQKCVALKKLCIKSCPVSDHGMEALAGGCPNLLKVKVKKCRAVTSEGADWLRLSTGSLAMNLDANEPENLDASASDSGAQEGGAENNQVGGQGGRANIVSSSTGRSASFKARLLTGRTIVACTFRRWSSFGGSSRNT